jgi:hypothetical protein
MADRARDHEQQWSEDLSNVPGRQEKAIGIADPLGEFSAVPHWYPTIHRLYNYKIVAGMWL